MLSRRVLIVGMLVLLGLAMAVEPVQAGGYDCTYGVNQSQIPTDECWALSDLYASTNGSSWTDNTGWLSTLVGPCDWHGISCSGGHVSQVNLFNNNVTGSLPSSLLDLPNLINLYLNVNGISGSIPTFLGSLTNLTQLALASNNFTGSIPTQLGNLSNLQALQLQGNQLGSSIPSVLGNLDALQTLRLNNNLFTGGIPIELSNLVNLEIFRLDTNPLTGAIPLGFTALTVLDEFNFSSTSLCEPPVDSYRTWKAGITTYSGTSECTTTGEMFYSQAAYDGWVLETAENTNQGGLINTSNLVCNVGDDPQNKQFRTILHFNTSRIPDDAVVTRVTLQYKQHSIIGSDPYATHGNVWADIKDGFFSNNPGLVVSDFAAGPSMGFAGYFVFTPSALAYPIYRAEMKDTAYQYLNLTGITQFRLRFGLDDDNDNTADYLKIFCGDMGVPFNRPVLRVWYYVP